LAVASKEELRGHCERAALRYGERKDNLQRGLEYYSIHVLAQREGFDFSVLEGSVTDEVDLSDYVTAGKDDLSIDGLLFDQVNRQVAIVQTTWVNKLTDDLREKASHFFNRLPNWMNLSEVEKGNEKVRQLLFDASLDPTTQRIGLFFVLNVPVPADHRLRVIAREAQESYADRGWDVECIVLDRNDLARLAQELANARSQSVVPAVSFRISADRQFIFPEEPRVLVCAIKGNELAAVYNRQGVRNNLFNGNIRLALTSGKINPTIQKTAQDPEEGGSFFYFNNGVTATCTSFSIDAKNEVTAKNMQVVNGAQTVNALAKALRSKPNDAVYVMLRLIETGEAYRNKSNFAENITRYQNTQNPVRLSDFFSNEPLQLWLRDHLAETISGKGANAPFYYVHKRGYKPSKAAGAAISLEELAHLRHAMLYGPVTSYSDSKSFWDMTSDSGRYWEAFGRDGKPCESWTNEEMAVVGWGITTWTGLRNLHKQIRNEARKDPDRPVLPEYGYLGYLARYVTALAHSGLLQVRDNGDFSSFVDLMASRDNYRKFSDPIVVRARELLQDAMRSRTRKHEANARLNVGRDSEAWADMRDSLRDKIVSGYISFS
jgi:hypothetical protein